MNKKIYTIAQWTWGLPQTLIGSAVCLIHRKDRQYNYNGAHVTEWERRDGVSLGKFIFVPAGKSNVTKAGSIAATDRNDTADGAKTRADGTHTTEKAGSTADRFLLEHEYGHTIQSLILGPSYLLLVGIPSMVWNRLPYFREKRKLTGRSYYSAVFERTASELGAKAAKKKEQI